MKRLSTPIYIAIVVILIVIGLAITLSFATRMTAEIKVTIPDGYTIGELVVLDAEESPGVLQWTILPETQNFKIVGKTAYFSSSNTIRYTVFISGTTGGTLATKVIFLNPADEPKVEPKIKREPKFDKILKLIDGGIVTTLDEAVVATKQLGIEIPEFKTLEEYKTWIVDNS